MGLGLNVPFRSYVFKFIIGLVLLAFGSILMIVMINHYLNEWRKFWVIYLASGFIILIGYINMTHAARELIQIENLEKEKMKLENDKLKNEIKIFQKQLNKK